MFLNLLSGSGRVRANTEWRRIGVAEAALDGALGPVKSVVCLANLSVVSSQLLLLHVKTQGNKGNLVHDKQNDARDAKAVHNGGRAAGKLVAQLLPVVVEPAALDGRTVKESNVVGGKKTSEDGAHVAADAVERKDVETVVDAQKVLERGRVVAGNRRNDANGHCKVDGHETSSRRDAHKTSNGAGAHADRGPALLVAEVVDKQPCHGADAGSKVSVGKRVSGADGTVASGATVKAKPAKPQKHSAKDDRGHGMGLEHGQSLGLGIGVVALTADEGIGEGTGTGGHVDGTATGVVKVAELGEPSSGVPSPAGNRSVDDGQPDE